MIREHKGLVIAQRPDLFIDFNIITSQSQPRQCDFKLLILLIHPDVGLCQSYLPSSCSGSLEVGFQTWQTVIKNVTGHVLYFLIVAVKGSFLWGCRFLSLITK